MRYAIGLAGLAAFVSAAPHTKPRDVARPFGCATEPTDEFIAVANQMQIEEDASRSDVSAQDFAAQATINIPVYFHVVSAGTSNADGNISDQQLQQQLAVMNDNYAPHGIAFQLQGTDRTVNRQWANDQAELTMKRSLRKGTYGTLNIYFQTALEQGAFGYCYFPTNASPGSQSYILDGCAIDAQTVPGGSIPNFNEGKTVTHEVGHWFGLYHTFQGGCNGGDSVSDTPAQASSTSGCPRGRDSCPNIAGLDPITNYMDYSYDSCYEEFTAGQQTRMYNMYNTYRAGK